MTYQDRIYQDIFSSTIKHAETRLNSRLEEVQNPILECWEILKWELNNGIDPRTNIGWQEVEERFHKLRLEREMPKLRGKYYEKLFDILLEKMPKTYPNPSGIEIKDPPEAFAPRDMPVKVRGFHGERIPVN